MSKALATLAAGLTIVSIGYCSARAQDVAATGRLDARRAVEISEASIGRNVGAYRLTDMKGRPLSLGALRERPLVVSLVYSACSSVCPVTTQRLIDAVEQANRLFGSDRFSIVTVGFDAAKDTPTRMAQFASMQGIQARNWHVASGDSATISALLRDLGFSYATIAGGFDHITQITILDRDGRVYRHVYGDEFPIRMFIEPLKDVVYGTATRFTASGILDRIRFICTTFDPGVGRYRIDYGLVFGAVIAGFSLMMFGAVIVREWMRTMRRV